MERHNKAQMRTLDEYGTYKYLEVLEVNAIKSTEMKRRKKLLETKLYNKLYKHMSSIIRPVHKLGQKITEASQPENQKTYD